MAEATKVYFACPECKSVHVDSQMWVDANSGVVGDDTERYRWCNTCEENGEDGECKSLTQLEWKDTREGMAGEPEPGSRRSEPVATTMFNRPLSEVDQFADPREPSAADAIVRKLVDYLNSDLELHVVTTMAGGIYRIDQGKMEAAIAAAGLELSRRASFL